MYYNDDILIKSI